MDPEAPSLAEVLKRRRVFGAVVGDGVVLVALALVVACSSGAGGTSAACASAGGACVLGGVACATQAPSSAQDCNSAPPNPGGAICCLVLADAGPADGGGAGYFACGNLLVCDGRTQICHVTEGGPVSADGGVRGVYACEAIPSACAANVTCGCIEPATSTQLCSAANGDVTVTTLAP